MSKRNILYVVYAGNQQECHILYETTKREKAERFASDLMHENNEYSKIFIERKFLTRLDKREIIDE